MRHIPAVVFFKILFVFVYVYCPGAQSEVKSSEGMVAVSVEDAEAKVDS